MASKESKGRLMITKMCLENFKSYAGVREIGPFHKCFSSIVGPNGSGKSNVIDALLFVFGKRAKQLRLNKVSELVHVSSEHPNVEMAKVTVYFQEIIDTSDDDYTVVPESTITVSRIATKSNQSKYYLNEKASTFAQVNTFLNSRGIDLNHNRFLILQGEVEQIAMMKPKGSSAHEEGLLEYLEDIIGSNKYIEKTDEVEKQVEELNEKRTEKLNRMRAAEKERDHLESSKTEAETYLQKEKEVAIQMNKMFQKCLQDTKTNDEKNISKQEKLQEQLDMQKVALEGEMEALTSMEMEYNAKLSEHKVMNSEMEKTQKEYAQFERRDIKVREDIKFCKAQVKKVEASIIKEEKKGKDFEIKCANFERELPLLEEKQRSLEVDIPKEEDVLEKMMASLKEKTQELRVQMESKQHEVAPYHEKLNKAEAVMNTASTEIELLEKSAKTAKAQFQITTQSLEDAQEKITLNTTQLKKSTIEMKEKTTRLQQVEVEEGKCMEMETSLYEAVQNARQLLEDAKGAAQSHSSQSKMLQTLMAATKKGGALEKAGLLGRLGDLGSIDAKYDVAITTACGSLDNLVVKTTSGAQACVAFLRKHNLGRCTFIILEQLGYLSSKISTPFTPPQRDCPRLYDLVTMQNPDILATAFYFAMRDTLAAPDIDTASKVAYVKSKCQYRVVTLDGKMIELSGAMSGGGNHVRRGGMSSSIVQVVSALELSVLQDTFNDAMSAKNVQEETRDAYKVEKKQLVVALKSLKQSIPQMEMENTGACQSVQELSNQIQVLQDQLEVSPEDQVKVKALTKSVDTQKKEMKRITLISGLMDTALEELQKQIVDVGGSPVRKQKKKVDDLNTALDATQAEMAKGNVDASNMVKQVSKVQATIMKLRGDQEKVVLSLKETKDSFKAIEEEAYAVHDKLENVKKSVLELEKNLSIEKVKYDKVKKTLESKKSDEVDLQESIEDCERITQENTARLNHWTFELESLLTSYSKLTNDFNETNDMNINSNVYSTEELSALNMDDLKYEILMLSQQRDQLKANVNMASIAEYKAKHLEYLERVDVLEMTTKERDGQRREYDLLRRQRLDEFMVGFREITLKLKEMYQMITLGGDAELELVRKNGTLYFRIVY